MAEDPRKRKTLSISLLTLAVGEDAITWKLEQDNGRQKNSIGPFPEPLDLRKDSPLYESIGVAVQLLDLVNSLYREGLRGNPAGISTDALSNVSNRLIRHLGIQLYTFLFRGQIDHLLRTELEKKHVGLVRIEIKFETLRALTSPIGKAETWPWEFTRLPDEAESRHAGQFLAIITDLALTRKVNLPQQASTRIGPGVRVLLAVSSPTELPQIDGRFVSEKIKTTFGSESVVALIGNQRPLAPSSSWTPKATYKAFRDVVAHEKPHIIHLIAHGRRTAGGGEIAFMDLDGSPDWISGAALAQDLEGHIKKHDLTLVFLQICDSALPDPFVGLSSAAYELARKGAPAVIGMQAKIQQGVADTFAQEFYQCLVDQLPIDVAVMRGRLSIERSVGRGAFALPVVYLASYEISFRKKRAPGSKPTGGHEQKEAPAILLGKPPAVKTAEARRRSSPSSFLPR